MISAPIALHLLLVGLAHGLVNARAQRRFLELRLLRQPGLGLHGQIQVALKGFLQPIEIPVIRHTVGHHELINQAGGRLVEHLGDRGTHIRGTEDFGALLIDDLALIVGDIVEQQQLLADIEVVRLDLALRFLDLAREHAAFDDFAVLHAGELQQPLGAVRITEDPHQIVFHRQIEAAGARITLATRAAAQLIVDAPRFVALGADDVQTAGADHLIVALLPGSPRRLARGLVGLRRAGPRAQRRDCRRARCRCRGRPCWWRWSRSRDGRPARRYALRARAAWH